MDPFTLAAIGSAGGSTIANVLAGNKQAKLNKQQAAQNAILQERQLNLAEKADQRSTASTQDAYGNVIRYDPATNSWVMDLSPDTVRMRDASTREQMNQGYDAQIARGQRAINSDRRAQEGSVADSLLRQYSSGIAQPKYDPAKIASQMRLDRTNAINSAYDDIGALMSTQALRTGSSQGASIANQLAKSRANEIRTTMGSPTLEGIQFAEGLNSGINSDRLNAYNLFAGRASNIDNPSYSPENVTSGLADKLIGNKDGASTGAANAAQLTGAASKINTNPGVNTTVGDTLGDLSMLFASLGGGGNSKSTSTSRTAASGGVRTDPITGRLTAN